MKKFHSIVLVIVVACVNISFAGAQTLNASWAKAVGAEGNYNELASGPAGTFYAINMGSKYLVKYNASGTELWSKSNSAIVVRDLCTDASGNIYVTGSFHETLTLGSITLENTAPGAYNIAVIKYNSDGEVLSAVATGQSTGLDFAQVAVDADGNIYLAGYTSGSITFGATTVSNVYLAKLNATGVAQWAKGITASIYIGGSQLALDDEGKPYVGGYFGGNLSFGSNTLSTNGGYSDFFLAKYNTDGTAAWATSCGSVGNDSPTGIVADASGNIYMCGIYNQSKYALSKFNKTTGLIWDFSAPGTHESAANDITMDAEGNFYVTGYFFGPNITFDLITLEDQYGLSKNQLVVVKYNSNFDALWAASAGPVGEDSEEKGVSICAVEGGVVVTGTFSGETFTLGGSTMTNTLGDGSDELFLAKIGSDNVTPILSYSAHRTVQVYPNPTQGKIQLSGLQEGVYKVKLNTLNGQTVYEVELTDVNASLDVSGQTKGLYLLEVSNGRNFSGVGKLMIE